MPVTVQNKTRFLHMKAGLCIPVTNAPGSFQRIQSYNTDNLQRCYFNFIFSHIQKRPRFSKRPSLFCICSYAGNSVIIRIHSFSFPPYLPKGKGWGGDLSPLPKDATAPFSTFHPYRGHRREQQLRVRGCQSRDSRWSGSSRRRWRRSAKHNGLLSSGR